MFSGDGGGPHSRVLMGGGTQWVSSILGRHLVEMRGVHCPLWGTNGGHPVGSSSSLGCFGGGRATSGVEWGSLALPVPSITPSTPPCPPGDSSVAPARPYWPGEFVTTEESEGPGGNEPLRVEGPLRGDPPHPNGNPLPRDPPLLPLPHPHKGTEHPWGGHLKAHLTPG